MWYQLLLCLFIMFILWRTKDDIKKTKYILPLCFMLATAFFAVRYEYGNDYWHYYLRWDSGRLVEGDNRGTGEMLFYGFMQLFDKFYKYVIVHTILFCSILFYLVKRHVEPHFYVLFFFMFMSMSTMSYNMMSAMRSTMAACIIWLALEMFYLRESGSFTRKARWIPFIFLVLISGFFHTSALVFVVVPLVDRGLSVVNPRFLFATFIVGLIVNTIFSKELYSFLLNFSDIMKDTYGGYLDLDKTGGSSIFGMINKSIMLFPYYYICMAKDQFKQEGKKEIWILAMFMILIICFGLDLDGRFSLFLYVFVIIALTKVLPTLSKNQKIYCLVPMLFYIAYNHIYLFYKMQIVYYYTDLNNGDGCFLFYKTIFEAPFLP